MDQVSALTQYPFSATRRVELDLSGTRLGYDTQIQRLLVNRPTRCWTARSQTRVNREPIYYASAAGACVGDYSYSAFVGR